MAATKNLESHSAFLFEDGSFAKNFIISNADLNLSDQIDNENKDVLIIRERPTEGLNVTKLSAEAKYPINFTRYTKRFIVGLH